MYTFKTIRRIKDQDANPQSKQRPISVGSGYLVW